MKKTNTLITFAALVIFSAIIPLKLNGQVTFNRDTIILAAREIIKETTLLCSGYNRFHRTASDTYYESFSG